MTKTIPSTVNSDYSRAEYNVVAEGSELRAINLLASSFKFNVEEMANESNWKLSYNRRILACHYIKDQNQVAAIIQYQVIAKSGRKQAMKCSADYGVFYEVPENVAEKAVVRFCEIIGSFAVYPYFRALVAQMGWNAGLKLPPMPTIASTDYKSKTVE